MEVKQAGAQADVSEKDKKPTRFWLWTLCTTNGTAQFGFLLIKHQKKCLYCAEPAITSVSVGQIKTVVYDKKKIKPAKNTLDISLLTCPT